MPELVVDGRKIAQDGLAYVIAEIGHNHQGDIPAALGDGVKRPLPSEERPLEKGKKLVAARDLPAGHVLEPGDVVAKSSADSGLPPNELADLLGRRLEHAFVSDQNITFEDVGPAEELAARDAEQA